MKLSKILDSTREFVYKYAYFIFVLFIILITFRNWFFNNSILTKGDWYYYTRNSLEAFRSQYFHIWLDDQNFGRTILDVGQAPTYAMYGFLAKIGLNYAICERLIHFCPSVIFAPLSSYIYLRHISKNKYAIGVGSAVFCCNAYFLQLLTGDVTLAAAYSLAPLVLYCFINNYKNPTVRNAIFTALTSLLMESYEPRVFYVEMIAVLIYSFGYLILHSPRYYLKNVGQTIKLLLPFVLILLLSFYWLIGIYKVGGDTGNSILSRNLFGGYFFRLQNAVAISQPFWTGSAPVSFVYHRVLLNQWIIPILGVFGAIVRKRRIAVYFIILVCLGIFLGKQTSQPISQAYPWLYGIIPGFNAFREGSKFYLLTALGYSGLATIGIAWILEHNISRYLKVFAVAIPLSLLLFNLKPFFTNDIGTTVIARHIPKSYSRWNNFISNQSSFSRSLWIPDYSRWVDNTDNHPIVSAVRLSQSSWQELNLINNSYSSTINSPIQDQISSIYRQNIINELLNVSSVKYVVVPIRDTANDDDFFQNYGNDRDFYINVVKSIPNLKKVNINFDGLVVYKNMSYKNYFSINNQVDNIPSIQDAANYNNFETDVLNQHQATFYSQSYKPQFPSNSISDVFENVSPNDISNNGINKSITLEHGNKNVLYYDTNQPSYGFGVNNNQILFTKYYHQPVSINGTITKPNASEEASITTIKPNKSYYFDTNDTLYPIDLDTKQFENIGPTNSSINVYSSNSNTNLVSNPSFEKGLWHNTANNCNPNGSNGNVSILLSSQVHYKSRYSLELGSKSYTACTSSPPIRVDAGKSYRLKYEYQIVHGQKAGYDLIFNNPSHTVLSSDQVGTNDLWHELDTVFYVPSGATSFQLRLKGYPDDTNQYEALTYYDSLDVQPLAFESQPGKTYEPKYTSIDLSNLSNLDLQVNTNGNSNNLIQNPSLEQGLWQKTVGDCDDYDNKPILDMKLNKSSKTNGKQSLELDTTRHVACTSPSKVNVEGGYNYQLSFDYKSPNSTSAGFAITFNDPGQTTIDRQLVINNKSWIHLDETIRIPFGATKALITVYGYPSQYGGVKEINLYDNFSFRMVPNLNNNYYLVSKNDSTFSKPIINKVNITNPTKKYLSINGANAPFFLDMGETYNSNWRLELNNSKVQELNSWLPTANPTSIPNDDHINQDNFLNTWYINPKLICKFKTIACTQNKNGSYNISLVAEFVPQRYFDFGLAVSGATAFMCVGYLIISIFNKRSVNKDKSSTDKVRR